MARRKRTESLPPKDMVPASSAPAPKPASSPAPEPPPLLSRGSDPPTDPMLHPVRPPRISLPPSETVDIRPPLSDESLALPEIDDQTCFTGDLLRQVREAKGIGLKTISERTRIAVASLTAIEEERFESLPDVRIYVRGFVRSLAQEIGLDPDRVSGSYLTRWEHWYESQDLPKKSFYMQKS